MLIEIHILQNVPVTPLLCDSAGAAHICTYGDAKHAWISYYDIERSLRRCKMPVLDESGVKYIKPYCKDQTCDECSVPFIESALYGQSASLRATDSSEQAVHIAHMISTQAIEQSVDFFGAADDLQCFEPGSEGISGSAANDTICCYRYCSLDLDSLARNLSDLSHEPGGGVDTISLRQSYEWFISRSLQPAVFSGIVPQLGPSVPDCILVETRQFPVPVSYAGAFTDPVFYGADNSLESAAKRMLSHADRMAKNYQLSATDRLLFAPAVDNLSAEGCKRVGDVTELLDCLSKVVCHV